MAKLQLSGLLSDLVHGEVHNPAEAVLLTVHVAGNGGAQGFHQHTGGLLGLGQLAGGKGHEIIGLQSQGGNHGVLHGSDELSDTAYDFAVFVQAEPIGLGAGDHLHVRQGLVDEFPGLVEIADYHGLDPAALKGPEAAAAEGLGYVLNRQVDSQVRFVGTVLLHGLGIGDAQEGGGAGPVVFAILGKDGGQHVLQHGEHIILGGKGHLHV